MLQINKIRKGKPWWFKCFAHSHKEWYFLVVAIKDLMDYLRTSKKKKITIQMINKNRLIIDGVEKIGKDFLIKEANKKRP